MLTPEQKNKIEIRINRREGPNWISAYGEPSVDFTALFKTGNPSEASALMREIGVLDVAHFDPWNFSLEIPGFGVGLPGALLDSGSFVFGKRESAGKKILLGLSQEGLIEDEKVLQAIASLA